VLNSLLYHGDYPAAHHNPDVQLKMFGSVRGGVFDAGVVPQLRSASRHTHTLLQRFRTAQNAVGNNATKLADITELRLLCEAAEGTFADKLADTTALFFDEAIEHTDLALSFIAMVAVSNTVVVVILHLTAFRALCVSFLSKVWDAHVVAVLVLDVVSPSLL